MDVTNQIAKIRSFIDRQIHLDFISKEEKVIYYLLSLSIFYDFINGIWLYEVTNTGISISQVIRIFILVLFLYYLWKYSFSKIYILIPIGLFFLLNIWLSYADTANIAGLKFDITMALKYMYFIILTMSLISMHKKKKITDYVLKRIIYNNAFLFPLLFFISYIIGVGQSSYGNAGLKGAFFSLNGINAAAIVLLIFAVDRLYRDKYKIRGILLTIYVMVPLLLLGTKSSFIFTVFVLFIFVIFNFKNKRQTITFVSFTCIAIICLILIICIGYRQGISDIIHRQLGFIYLNRNSILTYLLSIRNKFLVLEYNNFINNIDIRRIIIGIGTYAEQSELAKRVVPLIGPTKIKSIEMDIFDIFFAYGVIGVTIIYGYVLKIFFGNIKKYSLVKAQPFIIAIICLIIFSILGGHVFGEPSSSTFLGISLCGLYMVKYTNRPPA